MGDSIVISCNYHQNFQRLPPILRTCHQNRRSSSSNNNKIIISNINNNTNNTNNNSRSYNDNKSKNYNSNNFKYFDSRYSIKSPVNFTFIIVIVILSAFIKTTTTASSLHSGEQFFYYHNGKYFPYYGAAIAGNSPGISGFDNRNNDAASGVKTNSKNGITTASTLPLSITINGQNSRNPRTVSANSTGTATTTIAPCESKVLEEIPPDPFYDVTDITVDAAKAFAEFLSTKSPSVDPENLREQAKVIAKAALNDDENLLAVAIAAPAIHVAVVQFRDKVEMPSEEVHRRKFLSTYWRELGLAWNHTEGSQAWGAPFRDCNALQGRWLWPFSVSVIEYGHKIVASSFIAADVDLCNDALEEIFGRKHSCDRQTTFCLLTETTVSSPKGSYTCICKESFYLPNSTLQGFESEKIENAEGENFSCIPCPGGCSSCDQNGACLFGEPQELVSMETLLRASIGSVLGACMLCCVVLSIIIFRQRKCKAIASGMWTVLETILLGIVLLYASVAVHFFQASTRRCLLEPWFRELGFITCYGAIILKLYRHLVEFRTRKAHRWVLRDVDLLKYLGTMVFAVICYMSAFTASSLDLIEIAEINGLQEVATNTCHPLKWEYITQISEILILLFGINLAIASRNANTQFRERQFLVASIVVEFIVSSNFYILRALYLPDLGPGAIFLALFIRSQLTHTITLGFIFLPKLWYQHKQGSHDTGRHIGGGGYAGLCIGDPDIGELTISEMSPEDIRAELKRLYTQLEILKNKTLRMDNPHISKRRGGRKAGHRRFSLQKKGSKDKALSAKHKINKHHDIEITEAEPSRTPEDSVCSAEGPTDTYGEISGVTISK